VLFEVLALGAAIAPSAQQIADHCHREGERFQLPGTIGLAVNQAPGADHPFPYAVLHLDAPLCYRDAKHGDLPNSMSLTIRPASTGAMSQPLRFDGQHLVVDGTLIRSGSRQDQSLELSNPTLVSGSR
jgi:hypothetical protein